MRPKTKTELLQVRISPKDRQRAERLADKLGVSISEAVRYALIAAAPPAVEES